MEIGIITSCMPSERSGKNLWPEIDLVQGFKKIQNFEKVKDFKEKYKEFLFETMLLWLGRGVSCLCK